MGGRCLTENGVQALLGGELGESGIAAATQHLDACVACQLLVSAGVRTLSLHISGAAPFPRAEVAFGVGVVLAGRYELTRFLARGGMGEVYAAHDRMVGEEIALKLLIRLPRNRAEAISRLRGEVQVARRVTTTHVSRVFDLGTHEAPDGSEFLFITMELLSGETLRQRLSRAGNLRPSEAWRLARDMAAGLSAAHAIGVVHRDFKSDNVMLVASKSRDGDRAVIMDFGLAQLAAVDTLGDPEHLRPIVGTLGYMAPEQLDGRSVTAAADVYAFGVVLHEMLTGVLPPFRPRIKGGGDMPHPASSGGLLDELEVPRVWKALVRRCLSVDPAARFANMAEVERAMTAGGSSRRRLATAVALAAGLGVVLLGRGASPTKPPPAAAPPPVAVTLEERVAKASPAPAPAAQPPVTAPRAASGPVPRPIGRRRNKSRPTVIDLAASVPAAPAAPSVPEMLPDDAIDAFSEEGDGLRGVHATSDRPGQAPRPGQ